MSTQQIQEKIKLWTELMKGFFGIIIGSSIVYFRDSVQYEQLLLFVIICCIVMILVSLAFIHFYMKSLE